jgi:cytochrome c oxidase subunit 4
MDPTQAQAPAVPGHVLPASLYLKVFGALLVLTGLTVAVSIMGLGAASLMVALTIAVIKAGLVIGFFMHLRYESRFLSVVFFSSVIFLLCFFVLTLIDVRSRADVLEVEGNTALQVDREAAARAAQRRRTPAPFVSPPASRPAQ